MSVNPKGSRHVEKHLCIMEKGQKLGGRYPQGTVRAEIGRQILFDTDSLNALDVEGCKPLHYDLLVLCAAIELADRRWSRPQEWRRSLHVTIPVIDLETWQKPEVLRRLLSVLTHLTGDDWRFSFIKAGGLSPIGFQQRPLDFGQIKTFAVAYSDGLDSRAVSALSGDKDEALCIRLANKKQRQKTGDNYFIQIPFKVEGYRCCESSFRSRGFQFAIVTAIAAQLSGVRRIVVPESGQGALGPVLLPLHNIHPDYRNHPTFFRKMESFINAVQGSVVQFEQPRIWSTKGKTLKDFLMTAGKRKEHLIDTRSCWQTRWVVNLDGQRKQCGLCAACMLRRLSLYSAGVEESDDVYVVSDLGVKSLSSALTNIKRNTDKKVMVEYGSVGIRHLQDLADMANQSDEELRVHASEIAAATGAAYAETLDNLRNMLLMHAEEWRLFLSAQGEESFLREWLDGGRYG